MKKHPVCFAVCLRYEFITTPISPNNTYGSLHDIQTDATFTLGPLFGKNPTLHNFGPRLGFAWDPFGDGKTALRGGFAELYDVGNNGSAWLQAVGEDLPYTQTDLTDLVEAATGQTTLLSQGNSSPEAPLATSAKITSVDSSAREFQIVLKLLF